MMNLAEICQDQKDRRRRIREVAQQAESNEPNGIDYVEVDENQQIITVYFLNKAPANIQPENVRITGGVRVRDIKVAAIRLCRIDDPDRDDCMRVMVDKYGDFSPYTLRLVNAPGGRSGESPLTGFDPRYAQIDFSFKANCPSDLDCLLPSECYQAPAPEPEINYLAKDYGTFRQLIFDRLALIMPDWQETHVPDVGVAMVELLAYVGDYLSYYQDAVATEAYLDTARLRISVRRHALLVDYQMHEGCNARTWVCVETDRDDVLENPNDVYFITGRDAHASGDAMLEHSDLRAVPLEKYEVFEPLLPRAPGDAIPLYKAHNSIEFYTWGDQQCCLPRGATSATLKDSWKDSKPGPKPVKPGARYGEYSSTAKKQLERGPDYESEPPDEENDQEWEQKKKPRPQPPKPLRERALNLKPGDVLIFEEVLGPKTGSPNDADHTRRHVVRLTKVTPIEDPLVKEKPAGSQDELPIPLVEIEWGVEDALPFHICLSTRLPIPKCELIEKISVARGNVILVDHGRTIAAPEYLGQVGQKSIHGECACDGSVMDLTTRPDVFRPILERTPLTFSEPLDWTAPASVIVKQDPRQALPQIHSLIGLPAKCAAPGDQRIPEPLPGTDLDEERGRWHSRRDLLASDGLDRHFVVEMDNDGRAHLRFGDGELGRQPQACMIFRALYRIGNGPSGNVGADVITTVGWRNRTVSDVELRPRNPLPATGGLALESVSEARLFAPKVFFKQLERAITADDYARLAERYPHRKVQRAGSSLKWTGSWYAAEVSIDPLGSETADPELFKQIKSYLYLYRRMGHDVEVELARYVPLKIELQICVQAHYLRGHVEAALLDAFSNRVRQDGRLGLFHPDNLTFGEGIYLSKLVATALAVTGVESVRVTKLERLSEGDHGELDEGILKLGPLEVPQLDNDPNFPERGTLKITLRGGR